MPDGAVQETPQELEERAERQRAELKVRLAELKSSLKPTVVMETAKQAATEAASDAAEAAEARVKAHPYGTGVAALSLIAAGFMWGGFRKGKARTDSADMRTRPSSDGATSRSGHMTRASQGRSALADVANVAPKIAAGLAAGYMLERYLPRVEGEEQLWEEARAYLSDVTRQSSRERLRDTARHPGSPVPLIALAVMAVQALRQKRA